MTRSNLIRWSGLAALVGGALTGIVNLVEFVTFGETYDSSEMMTSTWALVHWLLLLGIALLILGLMGLYTRQAEQSGALGLIAFLIAYAGTLLIGGLIWAEAFLGSAIAGVAPDAIEDLGTTSGPLAVGFGVTFISVYLGWLLFGLASLLAGVFPRVPALLLMAGILLAFIFGIVEIPAVSIIFDLAWLVAVAWMGFALWSEKPGSQTAPGM